MQRELKLHDVVAALRSLPRHGVRRGQVGTIVELYRSGRYEVEFADAEGQTIALVTLPRSSLLLLSYERGRRRSRSTSAA